LAASEDVTVAGEALITRVDAARFERASPRAQAWSRLRKDQPAVVGLIVVAFFTTVAVAAPLVATHDPLAIDAAATLAGPSRAHLLGTDNLGRDVFSRLVFGSRLSLGTAVLAAFVVSTIGVAVGLVAGLGGGWVDALSMRVVDGLLAFPSLILVLTIAGTLHGGLVSVVIGFTAVSWAGYARLVRGLVLQLRDQPFIEAARSVGASPFRIALRHVLPNVLGPVIVLLTTEMGTFVVAVSGLSFLGVGAQPPAPEWGTMLNEGRRFLLSDANLMVFPGVAVTLVALGFNLVGEGIRDALDPKRDGVRTRRRHIRGPRQDG
jgi:ABC-type dipeptide/oligopeptide/nickel transport system permease subunit